MAVRPSSSGRVRAGSKLRASAGAAKSLCWAEGLLVCQPTSRAVLHVVTPLVCICVYVCVTLAGNHNFELTTFEEACQCDVCNKLLCGCYFQGYYCLGGCGFHMYRPHSCVLFFISQCANRLYTTSVLAVFAAVAPCILQVSTALYTQRVL